MALKSTKLTYFYITQMRLSKFGKAPQRKSTTWRWWVNGSSCFHRLQQTLFERTYWIVHLIEQLFSLLHSKVGKE